MKARTACLTNRGPLVFRLPQPPQNPHPTAGFREVPHPRLHALVHPAPATLDPLALYENVDCRRARGIGFTNPVVDESLILVGASSASLRRPLLVRCNGPLCEPDCHPPTRVNVSKCSGHDMHMGHTRCKGTHLAPAGHRGYQAYLRWGFQAIILCLPSGAPLPCPEHTFPAPCSCCSRE